MNFRSVQVCTADPPWRVNVLVASSRETDITQTKETVELLNMCMVFITIAMFSPDTSMVQFSVSWRVSRSAAGKWVVVGTRVFAVLVKKTGS